MVIFKNKSPHFLSFSSFLLSYSSYTQNYSSHQVLLESNQAYKTTQVCWYWGLTLEDCHQVDHLRNTLCVGFSPCGHLCYPHLLSSFHYPFLPLFHFLRRARFMASCIFFLWCDRPRRFPKASSVVVQICLASKHFVLWSWPPTYSRSYVISYIS